MLAGAVAALAALRVASRGRNIVARACLATCAAAVVWLLSDLLFLYEYLLTKFAMRLLGRAAPPPPPPWVAPTQRSRGTSAVTPHTAVTQHAVTRPLQSPVFYIAVPPIKDPTNENLLASTVRSIRETCGGSSDIVLIRNSRGDPPLPATLRSLRSLQGRAKYSPGALLDALHDAASRPERPLALLQHSSKLRRCVKAPQCDLETLGDAKPRTLGIVPRHPGMRWASRLLRTAFNASCAAPCAAGAPMPRHIEQWRTFAHNSLVLSPHAQRTLRANAAFTAEIDRGRIGKDEDKGAERLWGILSAWFAGGGAPPPQCAQGAIWKTHGSSG